VTTSRRPTAASAWRLAVPPAVWLAHFAAVYATAALACGRWRHAGVDVGAVVLGLSVVALAGLAGSVDWRSAPSGTGRAPAAFAEATGTDAFLSVVHLLLAAVSGLGVVFVAASVAVVGVCR
jgi:hypothetical protein